MLTTNFGKRVTMIVGGAVLCFAAGATMAAPLFGPKGEFKTFLSRLTYDPSRSCYRPSRPYMSADDDAARRRFLEAAREHLECMRSAAKADTDYAMEVVADGYKEAEDEFIADMKRSR